MDETLNFDKLPEVSFENDVTESDRELLLDHYRKLSEEKEKINKWNIWLQAALNEDCRRNNIERAFYETNQMRLIVEAEEYNRTLQAFVEIIHIGKTVGATIKEEMEALETEREKTLAMEDELKNDFKNSIDEYMQTTEISQDQQIKHLLKWFFKSQQEVSTHRFKYIKVTNALEELKLQQAVVDKIAEGFTVTAFEKLTSEMELEAFRKDLVAMAIDNVRMKCDENMKELKSYQKKFKKIEQEHKEKHEALNESNNAIMKLKQRQLGLQKEVILMTKTKNDLHHRVGMLNYTNLLTHFDQLEEKRAKSLTEISTLERSNREILSKIVSNL